MKPPDLAGDGFRLRRLSDEDIPWVYSLRFLQPDTFRWLAREHFLAYETFSEQLSRERAQFIVQDSSGEPAGYAAVHSVDICSGHAQLAVASRDIAEVPTSPRLLPLHAVAKALARYAFARFDVRKVFLPVLEADVRRYRFTGSDPFSEAARLQNHTYLDGEYVDLRLMVAERASFA